MLRGVVLRQLALLALLGLAGAETDTNTNTDTNNSTPSDCLCVSSTLTVCPWHVLRRTDSCRWPLGTRGCVLALRRAMGGTE
jgi:hypothetical protein